MLLHHWSERPTLRDMVADYLGVMPPPDHGTVLETEEDFRRAFLMHGTVAHV